MNTLFLSGYGIKLRVDNAKLVVKDGRDQNRNDISEIAIRPKSIDYDNIVIYGHSGDISLDAIKWLSKQNVQLIILNWDGRLLTNVLIPEMKQNNVRMAQYDAARDDRKVEIAKAFIDAKIKNSILVLDWLTARYPELKENKKASFDQIEQVKLKLPKTKTTAELRSVEGNVANAYWEIVSSTFDHKFEFEGRLMGKNGRPYLAQDPINALLNYGYAMLEAQCWKAVNAKGLDPYIGFNHEMNINKAALIYDLQEPYRWLVDVAVFSALEMKQFDKTDFVWTENYNLRLKPVGVRKIIDAVNSQFTSKVQFKGKSWEWGYIIPQKAGELADYLMSKRKTLNFTEPIPIIKREDSAIMREKILKASYVEWEKMGFSKGSLYYLKQNAKKDEPFQVYGKVKERLMAE
jgi:CRISP-associated protein Cas1